ncbi:hypothetical protein QJS10_CPB12g01833 [Acorus calamus]|uniref:Uncharacterized protein n=1 Tax=Acorus calamus TaxID=4465 RepID=A0AAV9DQI1_ACOCL|nr:hypothetical protein QJS10_CPB12g01833 [Acorus calamus]
MDLLETAAARPSTLSSSTASSASPPPQAASGHGPPPSASGASGPSIPTPSPTDSPTQGLRSRTQKSALTSRPSMMLKQSRPLGATWTEGRQRS